MRVDCLTGVPVDSSGAFAGCERMPAALRVAGLAARLGLADLGNLQVVLADPVRDPATGIIGFTSLVDATAVIRSSVAGLLDAGRVPLLAGGDCSILIGIAAALADTAPGTGLAFIDGHLDCYTGQTSPTGEAADMELAILLCTGPPELTGLVGGTGLIRSEQVICLGPRDREEAEQNGAGVPPAVKPRLGLAGCEEILATGPAAAGRTAARYLGALPGFWIHLDLDVLSTRACPPSTTRNPEAWTGTSCATCSARSPPHLGSAASTPPSSTPPKTRVASAPARSWNCSPASSPVRLDQDPDTV